MYVWFCTFTGNIEFNRGSWEMEASGLLHLFPKFVNTRNIEIKHPFYIDSKKKKRKKK